MRASETIIVMYHYVRPTDRQHWGGLFPLEPAEFEQQLDYLEALGTIIPAAAMDRPVAGRRQIVLTFDDGTRDHYEYVFPILQQRGLSGLFGVISGPALGTPLPNVHLIHWLLSQQSDAETWAGLVARFGEARLGAVADAARLYTRDTPLRGRVKLALNFALPYEEAADYLDTAVRQRGTSPEVLAQQWYLSADEIAAMYACGMEFAVHAHRHRPYAGPAERFYQDELEPCAAWLTRLTGARPRYYIAAFGGSQGRLTGDRGDVRDLAVLLGAGEYRHGFLTERGTEPAPPWQFFLKRVDCADLPPRQDGAHSALPELTGAYEDARATRCAGYAEMGRLGC